MFVASSPHHQLTGTKHVFMFLRSFRRYVPSFGRSFVRSLCDSTFVSFPFRLFLPIISDTFFFLPSCKCLPLVFVTSRYFVHVKNKQTQPLRLEIKKKLSSRSDRVKSVDIHPSEPWVLSALYNGHVFIWDYEVFSLTEENDRWLVGVRLLQGVDRI